MKRQGRIGRLEVIEAVTGEGAVPAKEPRADVLNLPVGGGSDVIEIEIDQMLVGSDTVRIMAGSARRFLVH